MGKKIEDVKEYWDERPCNVRYSLEKIGTKKYFDEVEARKYFVGLHILPFVDFERWRGKKVLEIGCGIGSDTINFARHGAQVTVVELSASSLEITKQRAKVYGLENNIRFYLGNSEELSKFVPIEAYDLIFSFGVIHHTPNPENVIKQIRSYVHPGSTVKIMVYNRYSWKVFWILLTYGKFQFWKLRELIARYSEAQEGCPITYTYTKNDIKKLLEDNGFKITEIFIDHIFPYSIPDYVQYKYVKVWYFRWMPLFLFRFLERHFGWHLCITAVPKSNKN